jgi:hypothetical protein
LDHYEVLNKADLLSMSFRTAQHLSGLFSGGEPPITTPMSQVRVLHWVGNQTSQPLRPLSTPNPGSSYEAYLTMTIVNVSFFSVLELELRAYT